MSTDRDLQRSITTFALRALDGRGFALAGSGAIREHEIADRLTRDVDLFTSETDPSDFEASVDHLVAELRRAGNAVAEVRRSTSFAQLLVTAPDGRAVDVDLAVDWRERDAIIMPVGPVLSLEDAVASKVSALYSRCEARDYLDVDAIRNSGRFTDTQLLRAAAVRDAGFEVEMFAQQLDRLQSLPLRRFEEYGLTDVAFEAVKRRFRQWATEMRAASQRADGVVLPTRRSQYEQHEDGQPGSSGPTRPLS